MSNAGWLPDLVRWAHAWVEGEREARRPFGRALRDDERAALMGHFDPPILESVRIAVAPVIPDPPFYPKLRMLGVPGLIPFADFAGITFIDCVLVSGRFEHKHCGWRSLLFHEMVHVAQYAAMGSLAFMEAYVQGWAAAGFSYPDIPLERQAYALQRAFERGDAPFQVRDRLRAR